MAATAAESSAYAVVVSGFKVWPRKNRLGVGVVVMPFGT